MTIVFQDSHPLEPSRSESQVSKIRGELPSAYQQALTILDDLDHPDADNIRTKLGALRTPATRSDQPQPDSNP
jgi:hypothetical protein